MVVIQSLSCMLNVKLFLNALGGQVDLGTWVCFMHLLLVELQYWLSKKPWEAELSILVLESAHCEGRDPFDLKVSRTFFLPVLLKISSLLCKLHSI